MKPTLVEDLKGHEVLAVDVLSSDFTVLLSAETELNDELIAKLKNHRIYEVYLKDVDSSAELSIIKDEVRKEVHETLQSILEKHTYAAGSELEELSNAADKIISDILEEEDLVNKLYDIRRRSADIYEHCISVCSISTLIALKRRLSGELVHDIGVACLIHELGLKYITVDYVNKEIYEMTESDAMEYKKHPIYGYAGIENAEWLSEAARMIVLTHHERDDGSGFPYGTINLPEHCQIVQICDVFDELICGIGCERVKVYEALEYLKIYKGTKFDKTIVDDFMALIAVYPVGSYVRTSEGELGVVLRQNKDFPDRPVVRIIKDREGKAVKNIIIKDLLKITTLFIEDAD